MSKVITFSRYFPSYHPRKGEETFFREKIWCGLADIQRDWSFKIPNEITDWDWYKYYNGIPKWHTIRAGNRWKVGDKFSPRVWSDKPYRSKQIIIAPDIEIKKLFYFEYLPALWIDESRIKINGTSINSKTYLELVNNDGLNPIDFIEWFGGGNVADSKRKPFSGQIICWNEKINY